MSLIKPYTRDGVTLHINPRVNLRYHRLTSELQAALPETMDFRAVFIDRFAILDAQLLAPFVTIEDGVTDSPFAAYIEGRQGLSTLERFELFETLFEYDHINWIYDAWQAVSVPEMPLVLPDDVTDEQAKKNTSSDGLEQNPNSKAAQNGKIKNETSLVTVNE